MDPQRPSTGLDAGTGRWALSARYALRALGYASDKGKRVGIAHKPTFMVMSIYAFDEEFAMSRLTIDLTDEQHKHLKAVAALEGKTMRQFAVERLFPVKDELDEDWERFREFIGKRVDDAMASEPSKRSILDIAEDGMRRFKAA